jgi:hypothetical protein
MPRAKAITGNDLVRFVRNLNVKHNVDTGEAGAVFVECRRNANGVLSYRASIVGTIGDIHLTKIGTAREVIDELRRKDWRRILAAAKATRLPPNRRVSG